MFYFKTLAYSALLQVSFFIYLLSSFFFLFGFKRYLDFTAFYFALALCSCIASCYKKPRNINSKPSRCCWSFVFISLSLVAIDCAKKGGRNSDAYVSIVKKSRWRYFFFVASLVRTAVSCETPRSPQDIARHVTELLLTVVYDNLRRRMPRNTLRVKISRERVSPPNRRKLSSKLVFLLIIKASHIQINSF